MYNLNIFIHSREKMLYRYRHILYIILYIIVYVKYVNILYNYIILCNFI